MSAFPILHPRTDPFVHCLADDFLEPELYTALEASFPSCEANSGPTGYSLFRGDPDYATLVSLRPEWRILDARVQSQGFIDYLLAQFETLFAREAVVDLTSATYSPRVEDRREKELPALESQDPADALFVRMDILQGRLGYSRTPHLDHRRRAATMLLYFADQEEHGIQGGELVLWGRGRGQKPLTVPIRRNRMVVFPCYNGSIHSVRPITAQRKPRNFVQITVSSTVDLWRPVRVPAVAKVVSGARRYARALLRPRGRREESAAPSN